MFSACSPQVDDGFTNGKEETVRKKPGPFFMKLRILGDIHKICISGKIFAFHRSAKDTLEHLLF